jgi:hypothetical protein
LDVAWGFISDVDFDSEVFRWMGKARFTVTAIEKLVSNDSYRARISFILADFVQQPCVQIHCPVCASAAHARQLNEMLSIAGSGTAVEPEKLFQGLADESDGDPTDEDDYDGSKSGSDGQQTRLLVNDEEKFDEEEEVGPGLRYIGRRAAKANWKVIEDNFSLFVASNVRGISTDTFLTPYAHLSGARPRLDACTHLFATRSPFLFVGCVLACVADGCLDVCFMRSASRANLTKVLLENEKGDGAHLGIEGTHAPHLSTRHSVHWGKTHLGWWGIFTRGGVCQGEGARDRAADVAPGEEEGGQDGCRRRDPPTDSCAGGGAPGPPLPLPPLLLNSHYFSLFKYKYIE